MGRCSLFVLLSALAGCFLVLSVQETSPRERKNTPTGQKPRAGLFQPVNPPEKCQKFGRKYYIWTPKKVYLKDEDIPLYIEVLFVDTEPQEHAVFLTNPIAHINFVKIEKAGYGVVAISNGYLFGDPANSLYRYRGEFIAPESEIDRSKLHGRLITPIHHPEHDLTVLETSAFGECYVMKIKDIRMLWRLFWEEVGQDLFDERGLYRVQYRYSNIIEFEIR